jgi:hypothetical protein
MKVGVVILVLLAAGGVAYCLLVPRDTFLIFPRRNGGSVVLSRWRIEFEPPPDHHVVGAFDQIDSYVSRLMAEPRKSRWVMIFTPSGDRGFALHGSREAVEAHLTVEWREQPEREAAIRAFFKTRHIPAIEDYLAGNGAVPDATRLLAYPLSGTPPEVAAMTRRILEELCGVSSTEPLNVRYSERSAAPPNNEMQRTRPAQAMELRR